ncbi:efflux RND transporter periplasmic adaptor subunit [Rhizobium sp. TRM95796]|uniref:efflux RND transporter periplasmic adaptor subunit n=1 Tax=Rhizobium sp. TRM95796 TaxID=2979862 RepID=UPI0021E7C53A|nr:efflux RND transporter periplasmic adaptor subunit [Rhizobium sp. TRM95796]MCV3766927.1 efflux RND transporter periplasmic adaptor subunit [Rhizobium sp. TRM95796]
MKKWAGWLTLAILLIAAAGGYIWLNRAETGDPLANVITAKATRGDIEVAVLATGAVRPARLVAVGAQASGRITDLHVTLGQKVSEGDLVAEIDSLTQQNALKTAEAALANVRAQRTEKQATLTYAESALERSRQGLASRATSQDAFENAQTAVFTARAQIAALDAQIAEAQVAVASARVDLGYTRVTAPMDGTVLLVVAQQGQTVNAAQTAPTIVVLGQIDRMLIQAEISEADVVNVKPGQDVYFTVLGDGARRWEAKLDSIDPAPDSLRSDSEISTSSSSSSVGSSSSTSEAIYYFGRFTVPNTDGVLKTYMTAQVHIVLGRAENVILAPASAIQPPAKPGGKSRVEVVGPNKTIAFREVETGLSDKLRTEIKSGLEEGDVIVTSRGSTTAAAADGVGRPPMRL